MRARWMASIGLVIAACSGGGIFEPADGGTGGNGGDGSSGGGIGGGGGAGGGGASTDAGATDAGASDGGPDASMEPALTTVTYVETDGGLLNPERGFYDVVDLTSTSSFGSVRANGMTLALAGVRLDAFRSSAIDAGYLVAIENGLSRARDAGIK